MQPETGRRMRNRLGITLRCAKHVAFCITSVPLQTHSSAPLAPDACLITRYTFVLVLSCSALERKAT